MDTKSLGFIGGGRITKIFLQAFQNKHVDLGSIVVYDANSEILNALKKQYSGITTGDSPLLPAKQEIVFIALHPPVIMETLEKIKKEVFSGTTVISLAPKITIEKISGKLNTKSIVRLIPNATSYINEGFNPVCFSSNISRSEKQEILELLNLLGKTFEVPEVKLESYAILSAMLPTYFWFQWKELQKIGIQIGLSESESRETVYQTMMAALNLMFQSNLTYDQVIDLIPVKPIAEHEEEIKKCFQNKLIPLFEKIKP